MPPTGNHADPCAPQTRHVLPPACTVPAEPSHSPSMLQAGSAQSVVCGPLWVPEALSRGLCSQKLFS